MSVSMQQCLMDYCNFSGARFQQIHFEGCSMREITFYSMKWKEWTMNDCVLSRCEFADTSLKDLDVTACQIEGWQIDPYGLRGLKVTKEQALTFAGLLGIRIMDL